MWIKIDSKNAIPLKLINRVKVNDAYEKFWVAIYYGDSDDGVSIIFEGPQKDVQEVFDLVTHLISEKQYVEEPGIIDLQKIIDDRHKELPF